MTYRFLDEYANFKKRQVKKIPDKEAAAENARQISRILDAAHHGIITLDEAMRELSYL